MTQPPPRPQPALLNPETQTAFDRRYRWCVRRELAELGALIQDYDPEELDFLYGKARDSVVQGARELGYDTPEKWNHPIVLLVTRRLVERVLRPRLAEG